MEATRIWADELTRLQAVQARVRSLARNHGWFGDAIRAALDDFLRLRERYRREQTAMHNKERGLARDLLARGFLSDPLEKDNTPCLFVPVKGLCPVALADQLAKFSRPLKMPRKLEREGAKVALAAFDREEQFTADGVTDEKLLAMILENRQSLDAGTHVWFSWTIVVLRPCDWQHPADPGSLDRVDLERFSDSDFVTIALHRLGGLADVGALRPIVPEPKDTGDRLHDLPRFLAWRGRLSVEHEHLDHSQPPLSVREMPADVAEQLLHDVETWAQGEARSRDESLTAREPSVSPLLLEQLHRAAAAVDPGAIDRATERAAEKVASVFGGGDNGDTKHPALPPEAEAIDENDVSLLAFLNQTPTLRRKVADVLPEKGPQDRKAVARRLRKLADRTPPLVDYPKDGRSGVAILQAGVEALKRANPPTPR